VALLDVVVAPAAQVLGQLDRAVLIELVDHALGEAALGGVGEQGRAHVLDGDAQAL
jgi:hypothetical protein